MQIINDNFRLNAGKSIDDRLGKVVAGKTVPFVSVTEANTTILVSFRYVGLTVLINDGTGLNEYWYKDGVTDANLTQKTVSSGGSSNIGLPYVTVAYDINLDSTVSSFTYTPTLDFIPANVIVSTTDIEATGFNYSLANGVVTIQYSAAPSTGDTWFNFTFFKPNS